MKVELVPRGYTNWGDVKITWEDGSEETMYGVFASVAKALERAFAEGKETT